MHGDICPADGCKDTQSIRGRLVKGGIAVNGADAKEVEGRMMGGEKNRVGILSLISVLGRLSDMEPVGTHIVA